MFRDFYVRVTVADLLRHGDKLLRRNLRPEIYVRSEDLERLQVKDSGALKKTVAHFDSHTVHAPFFDLSTGGFDPDVRDLSFSKLAQVTDLCETLHSRLVVIHFNYNPVYYRDSLDRWLTRSASFFRDLLKGVARTRIALENIAEATPDVMTELVRRIDDPRMIYCMDVGHHNVFGTTGIQNWLRDLRGREWQHFHFHDNAGETDSHLPPGRGTVDWATLRRVIPRLFPSFSVTLEPSAYGDLEECVAAYRHRFL